MALATVAELAHRAARAEHNHLLRVVGMVGVDEVCLPATSVALGGVAALDTDQPSRHDLDLGATRVRP